ARVLASFGGGFGERRAGDRHGVQITDRVGAGLAGAGGALDRFAVRGSATARVGAGAPPGEAEDRRVVRVHVQRSASGEERVTAGASGQSLEHAIEPERLAARVE